MLAKYLLYKAKIRLNGVFPDPFYCCRDSVQSGRDGKTSTTAEQGILGFQRGFFFIYQSLFSSLFDLNQVQKMRRYLH